MPSLKELQARISSIRSIKKTTKAMQMIAASYMNKATEALRNSAPYTHAMRGMLNDICNNCMRGVQASECNLSNAPNVIVVTSNRGLCGSFNSSVVKAATKHVKRLNKGYLMVCVGRKCAEAFGSSKKLLQPRYPSLSFAQLILSNIPDFKQGLTICYNKFISVLKHEVVIERHLPLAFLLERREHNTLSYDPDFDTVLEKFYTEYIVSQIFSALLENAASEHSARMMAMENANRNTKEMLKVLEHQYNTTRQAIITKELIEVISGAEANLSY